EHQAAPFTRRLVLRVLYYAHDFPGYVPGIEVLAERVLRPEEMMRHALTQNRHLRRTRRVLFGKIAAREQVQAHGLEVSGSDYAPFSSQVRVRLRDVTGHLHIRAWIRIALEHPID